MKTLADRIRWILQDMNLSERELSTKAGLAGSHVGMMLRRLAKNPRADIENKTLVALATAAGISVEWMASGKGSPRGGYAPPPTFPNRQLAMEIAVDGGMREDVVAAFGAEPATEDHSVLGWIRRLIAFETLRS